MSGLLFNVDCVSRKSVYSNVDDRRTHYVEKATKEAHAPVAYASTIGHVGNWRRKHRSKSIPQSTTVSTARRSGAPVDSESRSHVRPETVHRSRTCGICCPTQFFCDEFLQKIEANRVHENQRWIFDLIDKPQETTEVVFINREDWILVQGSSYTSDIRYLVVFKDKTLKTIRDLRQKHIPMLKEVECEVLQFLQNKHHNGDYKMYFHYLPSVFQLHLHVCCSTSGDSIRRQYLHCVMRNILQKDTWYADALILFASPRTSRAQSVHATGNVEVSDDVTADKQEDVCI
jgi:hypothetical protein